MKQNKTKFIIGNSIFLVAIIGLGVINHFQTTTNRLFADPPDPYSIIFNSTANKIGTETYVVEEFYSGIGEARTELNNAIAFEYEDFANPTDKWQTIKAGGYFTNKDPIMGMTSLSIVKYDTTAYIGIFWSDGKTFYEDKYVEFDSLTATNVSTNFEGYLPNYIKVVAVGIDPSSIISAKIEFSCANTHELEIEDDYYLGLYPQTKVTNETLIIDLNAAAGTLPVDGNSQSWTSYNYKTSSKINDFTWYQDVENGGDKYRGVYYTYYRPYYTTLNTNSTNSYQDDNGYIRYIVYWFKFEPIKWDIISIDEDSGPLVVSSYILDSQDYYQTISTRSISGSTVYPNNYKESNVRSWLNYNFYNTAFTTNDKSSILTTTVDNSVESSGYDQNVYACADTSDNVFLLSYADATNEDYGFTSETTRLRVGTDYAKAMGLYVYDYQSTTYSHWWLRSPDASGTGEEAGISARYINNFSYVISEESVHYTDRGILPAFRINR